MIQQGQVFKLKATGVDGEPLWSYRYRVAGRGSARRQVGGFTTKAEAQRALQNRLARLVPGGRAETLPILWSTPSRVERWSSSRRGCDSWIS